MSRQVLSGYVHYKDGRPKYAVFDSIELSHRLKNYFGLYRPLPVSLEIGKDINLNEVMEYPVEVEDVSRFRAKIKLEEKAMELAPADANFVFLFGEIKTEKMNEQKKSLIRKLFYFDKASAIARAYKIEPLNGLQF